MSPIFISGFIRGAIGKETRFGKYLQPCQITLVYTVFIFILLLF